MALQQQTETDVEITILDGGSSDGTRELAAECGVRDIRVLPGPLLAARVEGVTGARGRYTLLLDSDQVLERDTLSRAVERLETDGLDMLVLEERPFATSTIIEKLFELDRSLVQRVADYDPASGTMLPRFFRTTLLRQAVSNIPRTVVDTVSGQDRAIVYYEAWQISQKVDLLEHAIRHIEPQDLGSLLRKFYRWGYTSAGAHHPRYEKLLRGKERFRSGLFSRGVFVESLGSLLLLALKGVPYRAGYLRAVSSRKRR